MANESERKAKLTLTHPEDPATPTRIGEIQTRRFQLGDAMIDLEQEKVKILVESRKLDEEKNRLFAGILVSRSITPGVPVEIDPENGKISLIKANGRVEVPVPTLDGSPPGASPAPPPEG